jgi:hypothetical protein
MEDFRFSLKAHGATGIFGLARKFKIADDDGSGTLELAEFDKVIAEHDLKWSPAQIKAVFDTFDTNKSGGIDYNEFLVGEFICLSEHVKHANSSVALRRMVAFSSQTSDHSFTSFPFFLRTS